MYSENIVKNLIIGILIGITIGMVGVGYAYDREVKIYTEKPKLRKAERLTGWEMLKFARLGCFRWPPIWHHRNRQEGKY